MKKSWGLIILLYCCCIGMFFSLSFQEKELIIKENHNLESEELSMETQTQISILINGRPFEASLEQNETTQAFQKLLPLKITMNELNGNEKYRYLESMLPSNPIKVETIEAGDIMLYGDNCLVLFYEDFKTSYSYTRIGKIENVEELQEVIGTGSIEIEIIK
ncbi:TPA: hypothetical protein IAB29_02850 [Candidatus Ventrenecus stercoripullorum]|nr:hypothetical protein [Candidatus Ventrenecus stercoripullorum]